MTAHNLHLGLGANLGQRMNNLRQAIGALKNIVDVRAISPVYETEPWGDTDQPTFLNLCITGSTKLPPLELLSEIKQIEINIGRVKTHRWGPRLIDIDILFYDNLILNTNQLTIPHPRMADRAFVLAPLADVAANFRHPMTDITVSEMLAVVGTSSVKKLRRAVRV